MQHKLHPDAAHTHFEMGDKQIAAKLIVVLFAVGHNRLHDDNYGVAIPKRIAHAGDTGCHHFGHALAVSHRAFSDQVHNVERHHPANHSAYHAGARRGRRNGKPVFVGKWFGDGARRRKSDACAKHIGVGGVVISGGPGFGGVG